MTIQMASEIMAEQPSFKSSEGPTTPLHYQNAPNPDSLSLVIGKAANLLPFAFLISAAGCLGAHYILGVPTDQLAVVVSVPIVTGFIFVRVLIFLTPELPKPTRMEGTHHRVPPLAFRVFAIMVVALIVGTISVLAASPVYYYIGLPTIGRGALEVAGSGAALTFVSAVSALVSLMEPDDIEYLLIVGLWKIWHFQRQCVQLQYLTKNGRVV